MEAVLCVIFTNWLVSTRRPVGFLRDTLQQVTTEMGC
jgi:hypothetical protein